MKCLTCLWLLGEALLPLQRLQHNFLQQVLHAGGEVERGVLLDAHAHVRVDHPPLKLPDGEAQSTPGALTRLERISTHCKQRRGLMAGLQAALRQRARQDDFHRRLDLVPSAAAECSAEALGLARDPRQGALEQVTQPLHHLYCDSSAKLLHATFAQHVEHFLFTPRNPF